MRIPCYSLLLMLFVSTTKTTSAQCFYPPMQKPADQSVCSGQQTTPVFFSASILGLNYHWVNDDTSIGLNSSGDGNMPAFIASNISDSSKVARITVTPGMSTSGTGYAYIANYGSASVSIVDAATQQKLTDISVGNNPYGLVVSPDGRKVYVANRGDGTVSVINTATNTTQLIQVSKNPQSIIISPDGTRVYVSEEFTNTVAVISTIVDTVVTHISTGSLPNGIAIHPDGSKVYVGNLGSNTVTIINTTDNTVAGNIVVGDAPQSLCVHPDGSKIYVANSGNNSVSVVETVNNTVIDSIAVQVNPKGIAIHPNGSKLYVSNYGSNTVSIINTITDTSIVNINVGIDPHGIAVAPDGKIVMVANRGSGTVSLISTATNAISANIAVGNLPVSQGNFIAKSNQCIGVSQTFKIEVEPLSNLSPAVSLAASAISIGLGELVTFTATATNGGSTPTFKFKVNNVVVQNSGSPQFVTDSLHQYDVVSCEMVSSIPCLLQTNVLSNVIQISLVADYVLVPGDSLGLFSDTANWLNGHYPGTNIGEGKDILIRTNGVYNTVRFDVDVSTQSAIWASANLIIEKNLNFTYTGSRPFDNYGLYLNGNLVVDGSIESLIQNIYVNGNTIINGGIKIANNRNNTRPDINFTFLEVVGSLDCKGGQLLAGDVINSGFISIRGEFGSDLWVPGSIESLVNYHVISISGYYTEVTILEMLNKAKITVDDAALYLYDGINDSTIKCHARPFNVMKIGGDFINNGLLEWSVDNATNSSTLNVVGDFINRGTCKLSNPGITDWNNSGVNFSGSLINHGVFDVTGPLFSSGDFINRSDFNVDGQLLVNSGNFTNSGSFKVQTYNAVLENIFNANAANTGLIQIKGKVLVKNSFINKGTFEILKP